MTERPTPPPAPSAPAGPTTAWTPPGPAAATPRRSRRGCVIAIIVAIVLAAVIGYFGLVFLGGQVMKVLAGTVVFGTGSSGCSVSGQAATFPRSTGTLHAVAYLKRETRVGETLTIVFGADDGSTAETRLTADRVSSCALYQLPLGDVEPGVYSISYRVDAEQLATGQFTITP